MSENNKDTRIDVDDILNEYSASSDSKDIELEQIITEVNRDTASSDEGKTPLSDETEPPEIRAEPEITETEAEEVPETEPAAESVLTETETVPQEDTLTEEDMAQLRKMLGKGAAFTMRTADDADESKIPTAQSEYTDKKDTEKILAQIARLKSSLSVRAAVLLFATVFSVFITAANDLNLQLAAVFDRTVNPSAYLFTNTILGIVAVGFSYSVITMGIKAIFQRRADSDSAAAVNLLAAIIAGLATLFDPEPLKSGFFHLYTSAAIAGMLFNTFGKLSVVRRTQRSFEYLSKAENIYAVTLIDNDDTAAYITNGSAGSKKELAAMRRTAFAEDFMKNSYSADLADRFAEKTLPFTICAAIIVGLLSIAFEKNSAGANDKLFVFLASVSGTLSICSSFALSLLVNLPLAKASRKLADYSGVMLGYSSAEDFADVNSVILDAGHLFPTGTVEFVNLKMLGSVMIDDCILYAASMANAAKSVTCPAFYKMLRGRLDMLLEVTDCTNEGSLGVSGRINSRHMLFGSRELMERHGVDGLPTEGTEDSFADGSRVVYLAVSGRAVMMFAVTLSVGAAAERWVRELEDESVELHVRSADGFITRELIAHLFDISASTVKIIPAAYNEDYSRITAPAERLSSSMLCSGHLPTFAMLLIAAKRVKFSANLGIAVQYGAMLLGAAISAVMMVFGSFAQITPTIVIIYNLAFALITYLMQSMRRI